MTTTTARPFLVQGDFAYVSDRNLVTNYYDVARERCTNWADEYARQAEMDAMHAELVRRDIDWDDPRWFS